MGEMENSGARKMFEAENTSFSSGGVSCGLVTLQENVHVVGEETPHWNLKSWLRSQGLGKSRPCEFDTLAHHLYVIGTQEGSMNEKDWVNKIKGTLQEVVETDMHLVSSTSVWSVAGMTTGQLVWIQDKLDESEVVKSTKKS